MKTTQRARTMGRVLAIVFAGALMVSSVAAGHNGAAGGKGSRVVPTGNEKCWVEPNPVTDGQQYIVWGTGFKGGQVVSIFVGDGGILMSVSDGFGLFSAKDWAAFRDPGTIAVKVYESGDRKMTVLATCSFQANGTL